MTTNTFTLTTQKSLFIKQKYNELINRSDLHRLVKSTEFNDYVKMKNDNGIIKTRLKSIGKKISKSNILEVSYKRPLPFGRMYAFNSNSYQAIQKTMKNSLARDKYMDIDIVNAHYTIIYNLCKNRKIKCPNIERYVLHRDEVRVEFHQNYGLSIKETKDLFNYMLYNINEPYDKYLPNGIEYLDNLKNEIYMIALQVSNDNPKMKKKIKTYKERENKEYVELRSLFAYYIQEYENRILEVIYRCLLKGYIDSDRVLTLFYDGIMIKRNDKLDQNKLDEICREVKTKLKIQIKLIVKPMDKKLLDFNEIVKIDKTKLKFFNGKYMNTLTTYESKCEYFNHFVKKILHPDPMYIWIDAVDRENHLISSKSLKESLLAIKSGDYNKQGDALPFFDKWIQDDNVKWYRKMDFIPYNPDLENEYIEDEDVFNLFTGYGDHIHTEYTKKTGDKKKKKRDKILDRYFKLVRALVGDKDENYNYYMAFLAQMIREPRNKTGISIVFKSEQGVGKGVHLIPIGKILKETHYKSSSKPSDFFGEHAEGYYRKILVNMDEVELKSSFKNEGAMKTAITEPKLTINPKFVRPIEIRNWARTIMFSNKDYILPIDIKSGDRRFVVFKSITKYLNHPSKWWIKLIAEFENPKFIAALYDYFMKYDYSKISWITDRPITEEYKKLLKQFIPPVALFMNDWILRNGPNLCEIQIDEDDEYYEEEMKDIEKRNIEAIKDHRENNEYKECKNELYNTFKTYIEDKNLCSRDYKPSIKNFENELSNYLGIEMNNKDYTIQHEELKKYLIAKKYMDSDLEEYKDLLKKEVVSYPDDYFYDFDDNSDDSDEERLNDYDSDEEKADE